MNNEEKILTMLEDIDKRLDKIEDDISEIKDDAAITRGTTNELLDCWTERFGKIERVSAASFS